VSVILLVISALAAALQADSNIPKTITQAIQDVLGTINAIFSSGATTNPSTSTILAALAGVIAALKADPNIPPEVLAKVGDLENILADAIAADKAAQAGVDPTKINPITPVE
jgi:hypothetical protein